MPNHVTTQIKFFGKPACIDKTLKCIAGEDTHIDFNKIIPMPKELNIRSGSIANTAIQYAFYKKNAEERLQIEQELNNTPHAFYGNYYNNTFFRQRDKSELEKDAKEFDDLLKNRTKDLFDDTDYEALGIHNFEDLGNAYINNIRQYGYDSWYDWRCSNWGTKWNAYDTSYGADETLTFDTAWSCPFPILEELADICANLNVCFEGKWADEDCGCNVGTFFSDEADYTFYYNYVENGSSEAYQIYEEVKGEYECIGTDENGNKFRYDCETCPHKCC